MSLVRTREALIFKEMHSSSSCINNEAPSVIMFLACF